MNLFALLFMVMGGVALSRGIRYEARRGANITLAVAWGLWAAGSLLGSAWLYVLGLGALVVAIYLNVTWPERALKELQRLAGLTDEDVRRLDQTARERELERAEEEKKRALAAAAERASRNLFRIVAKNRPVDGKVTVENERSFPVTGGGSLLFPVGPVTVRLRVENLKLSDECSALLVVAKIADEGSRFWQVESYMDWGSILGAVLDSDRGESGEGIHPWDALPETWMASLRGSCLVEGAGTVLDSRSYYALKIGPRVFTVREKYQGPKIDLACSETSNSFLVRVSELYAVAECDEGDEEDVPPFVFDLPFESFVSITNPNGHWKTARDLLDHDEEKQRAIEFAPANAEDDFPKSRVRFVPA